MTKMYETFKDIAEFRIVYIKEAHAADGDWPMQLAQKKNITEHKNYGQRCVTADMLMAEKKVTIPCIIDNMDNSVNDAYKGHPTRVYLVRKDGTLGVAAKRGPKGYRPGLAKTLEWLSFYKKEGLGNS
jgi:hypothetical protein